MTAGAQVPWENSSLTRQFYFVPGEAASDSLATLGWQMLPVSFDTGYGKSPGKGHKGAAGHGHGHGGGRG